MNDETDILEYLEKGGRFSSPDNAPPRYRAELMRQMASFVDSEMAGAAGFADCINLAPGVTERIAAARIVLEKFDHAERVMKIMSEFGANIERYQSVHPWTARVERDVDLGAARQSGDMRLNVFHYPLDGWTDAVVMNVLMGTATIIQLREMSRGSYQPLAETFADILPCETRHAELGREGLEKLAREGAREDIERSIDYWRPRVATTFGAASSPRFSMLQRFGLRHESNDVLQSRWEADVAALLHDVLGD